MAAHCPPTPSASWAASRDKYGIKLGCHFHNDAGCAVANSLVAVRQGCTQVQGCVNGYGERTGNADLCATVPNLTLKMGVRTIGRDRLERITPVAHHIAELVNIAPDPHQPYVGASAFAHKAGLHTSAIARAPRRTSTYHRMRSATAPASWSQRCRAARRWS